MRTILTMVLLLCSVGCERVVNVTVADAGARRLVVEARLERVRNAITGAQRIRLTTTDSYFNAAAPPPARGALVRVTDAAGTVTTFAESTTEPGVYQTNALTVAVGQSYTLRISWNGEEFIATETAMAGVPIDSLYFANRILSIGPKEGLRATISLRDPPRERNYYLWDQYVDGRRLVSPDTASYSRVVASDDLREGSTIRQFQPYDGIVVKPGQLVRVRQMAISEQAFLFYSALTEQALNDGSPFGVPPSSLRGNIANVSRPSNVGLGYFIVGEVTEIERRVP